MAFGLILPITSGKALDNTSHNPDYLVNPSFEQVTPSWYLEDQTGSAILAFTHDDFDVADGQVAVVVHNKAAAPAYQVQLKEENLSLPAGDYRLSFFAKTDFSQGDQLVSATVALTQQNAPWSNYGLWFDFSPVKDWREFRVNFHLANDITDGRLTFYLGKNITTYFLDDINIVRLAMPNDRRYNLALNGDFEYPDLAAWDWEDVESKTDFSNNTGWATSGLSYARIVINEQTTNFQDYLIQFKQKGIPLERGRRYKLFFDAKVGETGSSCPIMASIINDVSPWNSAGFERIYELGYDWQKYGDEFMASQDFDNARLTFQLGRCRGEVYLDNIKLTTL